MNFILEISTPLDQFEIRDYIMIDAPILNNLHISLTNIGLYIIMAFVIIVSLLGTMNKLPKVIIRSWVLIKECFYDTICNVIVNQINKYKGQIYFPFIFTLFVFILVNNLIGLIPYSFSATSHFILAFSWSFTIVIGATILGFQIHSLKFFSLFVPSGCPLGLLPLLVLIEFISYLSRPVSLGLRLGANILSGHMLLNILAGFTYNIMKQGIIYFFLGLVPLLFILAFSGLEIGIAFIQAQVFVVLSSSYIKDSLELH